MKRIITLILVAAAVLALASCGAPAAKNGKVAAIDETTEFVITGLKLSEGDFSMDAVKNTFAPDEKIEVSFQTDFNLDENGEHISVLCLPHRDFAEYEDKAFLTLGHEALKDGFVIKNIDTDDGDTARIGEGTLTEAGDYDLLIFNGYDLCYCTVITVE